MQEGHADIVQPRIAPACRGLQQYPRGRVVAIVCELSRPTTMLGIDNVRRGHGRYTGLRGIRRGLVLGAPRGLLLGRSASRAVICEDCPPQRISGTSERGILGNTGRSHGLVYGDAYC